MAMSTAAQEAQSDAAARGPRDADPNASRAAQVAFDVAPVAFNAGHWRAVDALIEACAEPGPPIFVAGAPGHGVAAVIAAALDAEPVFVETAQTPRAPEAALLAEDAVASRATAPVAPVWIAPASARRADVDKALSAIAAAEPAPFRILILRLPQGAPTASDSSARSNADLLSQALARAPAAARLIVLGELGACGALADQSALLALRPHGLDETRAFLRGRLDLRAGMAGDPRAIASLVVAATGGSPELLERIAARLEGAPAADIETLRTTVDDCATASGGDWPALAEAARRAALALAMPQEPEPEPEPEPADEVDEDADAPPPAARVEPGPSEPIAPLRRAAPRDALGNNWKPDAARRRLSARAQRRKLRAGLGFAAILTLVSLLILSGAAPGGRDPLSRVVGADVGAAGRAALLDVADGALGAVGAVADTLGAFGTGDFGAALEQTAATVQRLRLELGRAAAALADLPPVEAEAAREARLRAALAAADERIALGRYTAPAGGSAYDAYLEADSIAPRDARVLAGFDALIVYYQKTAEDALSRSDYDAFYGANAIIDRIRARRPI